MKERGDSLEDGALVSFMIGLKIPRAFQLLDDCVCVCVCARAWAVGSSSLQQADLRKSHAAAPPTAADLVDSADEDEDGDDDGNGGILAAAYYNHSLCSVKP